MRGRGVCPPIKIQGSACPCRLAVLPVKLLSPSCYLAGQPGSPTFAHTWTLSLSLPLYRTLSLFPLSFSYYFPLSVFIFCPVSSVFPLSEIIVGEFYLESNLEQQGYTEVWPYTRRIDFTKIWSVFYYWNMPYSSEHFYFENRSITYSTRTVLYMYVLCTAPILFTGIDPIWNILLHLKREHTMSFRLVSF